MLAVWRVAPGQQLAAWGWDDEFVVYNDLSGDTHVLGGDSVAILQQLKRAPASIDFLVETFSVELNADDAESLPETMAVLLDHLLRIFLVETYSVASATSC